VAAGAVDDDQVTFRFVLGHRGRQALVVDILALAQRRGVDRRQFHQDRAGQAELPLGDGVLPVLDIAPEAALPEIEVEPPHRLAQPRKRRGHMHGGRRLSRPSLFVAQNDDVCHCP
jgi:hypothetical protein